MVFKYAVILIFYNCLLVTAKNEVQVLSLEIGPNRCKPNTDKPFIILAKESFVMDVSTNDKITDATCTHVYNSGTTVAKAKTVTENNKITFTYENNLVINEWTCNFVLENKVKKQCNITVDIRKDFDIIINNKDELFNVNQDVLSEWHAVGEYRYTPKEILYFEKPSYNVHAYIKKEDKTLFETKEKGDLKMMINTNYYKGPCFFFLNTAAYGKNNQTLKLQLIPKNEQDKDGSRVIVRADGLPITPINKYDGGKFINYIYNYPLSPNTTITCEKRDTDKSTTLHEIYGNEPQCILNNTEENFYEEHSIRIHFNSPSDPLKLIGLPLNQTVYRLKAEALYEYRNGETLDLQCYNDKGTTRWKFLEKQFYGKDLQRITLNETCNGTKIRCTVVEYGNEGLSMSINLVMRRDDEPVTAITPLGDTVQPLTTLATNGELGQPSEPITYIIIIGVALIVAVIFAVVVYYVCTSYRKKRMKEVTSISYDNLPNNGTPPFPPNWDRINQARTKDNDEYSVPYAQNCEDATYAEPVTSNTMYAELTHRLNRSRGSSPQHTTAQNGDVYAQVIPKATWKKEDGDAVHDPDNYANVFKGQPYVNCDTSEYAEVAYCELSDIK